MQRLAATAALALCAGAASAASVTVVGALSTTTGSSAAFGVSTTNTVNFSATAGATSVTGTVIANNASGTNFLLTLTNLSFSTTSSTGVTIAIHLVQDFTAAGGLSATGSHQFNGNAVFTGAGQLANLTVVSTHEVTLLPSISANLVAPGAGTFPMSAGQGPATLIVNPTGVYTIDTTYTMTIQSTSAGGLVTLNLPNSGVDQATIQVSVPLPAGGLMACPVLALLPGARRCRRARR